MIVYNCVPCDFFVYFLSFLYNIVYAKCDILKIGKKQRTVK